MTTLTAVTPRNAAVPGVETAMPSPEASARFLQSPWLADLPDVEREAVLSALNEEHAPGGSDLLIQGQRNERLLFLIDGTVDVLWTQPNGRREAVTRITAPAVFGVPSFFRPVAPTVTVRASGPVWLLTMSHTAHEALRAEHPRAAESLAVAALLALSDRFDILDHRVCEFLASQPHGRPEANEWASFRAKVFNKASI